MIETAEYTLEKRSVNNKDLFDEINNFIVEGITTGGIIWSSEIHRQSLVDILYDFISDI